MWQFVRLLRLSQLPSNATLKKYRNEQVENRTCWYLSSISVERAHDPVALDFLPLPQQSIQTRIMKMVMTALRLTKIAITADEEFQNWWKRKRSNYCNCLGLVCGKRKSRFYHLVTTLYEGVSTRTASPGTCIRLMSPLGTFLTPRTHVVAVRSWRTRNWKELGGRNDLNVG